MEAGGRAEIRTPDDERTTNTPLRDATSLTTDAPNAGFVERIRQLEVEVARKNEVIAELAVLVLQAQGLLKGKKREGGGEG